MHALESIEREQPVALQLILILLLGNQPTAYVTLALIAIWLNQFLRFYYFSGHRAHAIFCSFSLFYFSRNWSELPIQINIWFNFALVHYVMLVCRSPCKKKKKRKRTANAPRIFYKWTEGKWFSLIWNVQSSASASKLDNANNIAMWRHNSKTNSNIMIR